jgi:hypothetical protein
MAITFPLDLPSTSFRSMKVMPFTPVSETTSIFSSAIQVQKYEGEMWVYDITLPVMDENTAEDWVSFFLKLNGMYGTFLFQDPKRSTPRGSAKDTAGSPKFDGAHSVRDTEIDIKDAPTSTTGYLKAGDLIQFGTSGSARMHKVLDDVDTDGSGDAAGVNIWPPLRSAYSDGDAIIVSNAKCVFRMMDNNLDYDIDEAQLYQKTFRIREALP